MVAERGLSVVPVADETQRGDSRSATGQGRTAGRRSTAAARPSTTIRSALAQPSGSEAPSARPRRRPTPSSALLALIRDEPGSARPAPPRRDRARRWWLARPSRRSRGAPRSRSPTASSGPSSASSRPPARSPRPRSSSGSPRMFTGHDLPDEAPRPGLPRQLPEPGRDAGPACHRRRPPAPEPGAHGAARAARRRRPPARHARLARPARAGAAGIGAARSATPRPSASGRPPSARISRAAEDIAEVDCIWYLRGKLGFLFEVEWTAMLGEPLLRRHARIPPDERPRPLPRDRAGADGARPPQARALAAAARGDGARQLARHQVGPPAGVPGARPARPRRRSSRTSGSTRSIERERRADAAVRRLSDAAVARRDRARTLTANDRRPRRRRIVPADPPWRPTVTSPTRPSPVNAARRRLLGGASSSSTRRPPRLRRRALRRPPRRSRARPAAPGARR